MSLLKKVVLILFFLTASCCGLQEQEYEHYLNLFQVRYFDKPESLNVSKSYPEKLVQFTLGYRFANLPVYTYVHFDSIDGHHRLMSRKTALSHYSINNEELEELFQLFGTNVQFEYKKDRSSIAADKIQKAAIMKIHSELVESSPELFQHGKDLKYGVQQNSYWDVKKTFANAPLPDSNVGDYQNGKTIVLPLSVGSKVPRLILNLNTPAVKEYCIRRALNEMAKNKTKLLFVDNTSWMSCHTNAAKKQYFGEGSIPQQAVHYAANLIAIFDQIKKRGGDGVKIIGNGLVPYSSYQQAFLDELTDSKSIDGIMAESAFAQKAWSVKIDLWLDWINKLKANGKMILFATEQVADKKNAQLAFDLWLWMHLIADDNTYFYMNHNYTKPMVPYDVYYLSLGKPLSGQAQKVGSVWKRKYQRGTIIFDVSGNDLSNIKLQPN